MNNFIIDKFKICKIRLSYFLTAKCIGAQKSLFKQLGLQPYSIKISAIFLALSTSLEKAQKITCRGFLWSLSNWLGKQLDSKHFLTIGKLSFEQANVNAEPKEPYMLVLHFKFNKTKAQSGLSSYNAYVKGV